MTARPALREPRSPPGLRRVFNRMLDGVDRLNRQASLLPMLVVDRRTLNTSVVPVATPAETEAAAAG